ncbi:hypothetical protein B0T22DRAFT_242235 [Podospora appendiculata]|uniref:Transmembrane protein n=1 Tax=Podospora appendiculata TaxID=314037 RepID=A0AAE0X6U6_9PEZI|nr:hypothetical protein B0T22DRAFT_242235 [Podospora appendiculata]
MMFILLLNEVTRSHVTGNGHRRWRMHEWNGLEGSVFFFLLRWWWWTYLVHCGLAVWLGLYTCGTLERCCSLGSGVLLSLLGWIGGRGGMGWDGMGWV